MQLTLRHTDSLGTIPAAAWNRLSGSSHPFLRHEFLAGLEQYHCLAGHGWHPAHLLAYAGAELVGAIPLYFKTNSTGEFVFDWDWAEAYEQAGGNYYPKLVSAIPYTPVTGPRCLVSPDVREAEAIRKELYSASRALAEKTGVSGLHFLFPDASGRDDLEKEGLLLRQGCQYHWFNHHYQDFNDFLETLSAKRRKQIKHERQTVAESGIEIEILQGSAITPRHWAIYHQFYASTFHRKWGEPRLTLEFFESLSRTLPEATLLFMARYQGDYVAGAFALRGGETLYGRHWGCGRYWPFLHFELCYYQTIEYCIENRLKTLDAGAQGEHKINRGFVPVSTWSAHWIADHNFRLAIGDFLVREQKTMGDYMQQLSGHLAYRSGEQK